MYEMTHQGYLEALDFLRSIGYTESTFHDLSSWDGYSIVQLANEKKESHE